VESGNCATSPGRIRIFRPDLTEVRVVPVGICAVDADIVRLLPNS
jgi:hypothetical protein